MLKGVGILCILAGSTGIGVVMAKELDLRIRELLTLQQMILFIRGEIRYMRQPLTDTFFHVSGSAPEPFRQFFSCTAKELEQRRGRTAGEIWRPEPKRIPVGSAYQPAGSFGVWKAGGRTRVSGCGDAGRHAGSLSGTVKTFHGTCHGGGKGETKAVSVYGSLKRCSAVSADLLKK